MYTPGRGALRAALAGALVGGALAAVAMADLGDAASSTRARSVGASRGSDPIYVKFNGVTGESPGTGVNGQWIQVDAFQWGVGRGISAPTGGGVTRDSTAPSVHELMMNVRADDAASPKLFKEVVAQHKMTTLQLIQGNQSASTFSPFYTLTFGRLKIVNVSFSAADQVPTMQVTFAFRKVNVKYGQGPSISPSTFANAGQKTTLWSQAAASPCDVC